MNPEGEIVPFQMLWFVPVAVLLSKGIAIPDMAF